MPVRDGTCTYGDPTPSLSEIYRIISMAIFNFLVGAPFKVPMEDSPTFTGTGSLRSCSPHWCQLFFLGLETMVAWVMSCQGPGGSILSHNYTFFLGSKLNYTEMRGA